jgi:hypothetical protein
MTDYERCPATGHRHKFLSTLYGAPYSSTCLDCPHPKCSAPCCDEPSAHDYEDKPLCLRHRIDALSKYLKTAPEDEQEDLRNTIDECLVHLNAIEADRKAKMERDNARWAARREANRIAWAERRERWGMR